MQELGRDCDLLYVCPSNSALAHLPYLVALDNATRCGPNLNPNPRSADAPLGAAPLRRRGLQGRRVQAAGACSLSLPALPWRKLLNRSATHALPRVFLCCRLVHFQQQLWSESCWARPYLICWAQPYHRCVDPLALEADARADDAASRARAQGGGRGGARHVQRGGRHHRQRRGARAPGARVAAGGRRRGGRRRHVRARRHQGRRGVHPGRAAPLWPARRTCARRTAPPAAG